ncbi:hypothetical protein KR074_004587, partial [Drosophila pseudoananassae]
KSTNVQCNGSTKFTENAVCRLKAHSWEVSLIQMDVILKQPLSPFIHFQVFQKDYSNRYHPFLINVTFNMCEVIARRNFMPYGAGVWRTVKKYTNANHSCPFTGHLFARNMTLDVIRWPPFPLGLYYGFFDFLQPFENNVFESFGTVKWYWEISEKRNKKK